MNTELGAALVTGARGFIGSALTRQLARRGARVTCLVRAGSAESGALAGVPGLRIIEAPSGAEESLRAALSGVPIEVVFHLASYGVRQGERDEQQMREGNVTLMERLLGALGGRPPERFIYTGSCSEYGPVAEPERLTEAHPIAPTSPYGAAKAEAGRRGSAIARELGVPFVPLRLFGVYGIGEAPHRLVPHLIAHLARGEAPNLTGGEQARDLTYIDDVVEALVCAATAPGIEPGTAYNVCTGEPVRIRAVAERVAAVMGKSGADLGLGRIPYRSDEAMWMVGDPARFMAATGWRPSVGLTEGIRRMVEASCPEARP